jgi:surface antigen
MTRFIRFLTLVVTIGCAGWATPSYAGDGGEFFGTGLGAALGGLVGNQFGHGGGKVAATVTGVVLGGVVGNSIGQSYDNAERASYYPSYGGGYGYSAPVYYGSAYQPNYVAPYAPPPSQTVYYAEPAATYQPVAYQEDSPVYVSGGYAGTGANTQQQYCREYTQRITINGKVQETYGTACLQPDGRWRIQP